MRGWFGKVPPIVRRCSRAPPSPILAVGSRRYSTVRYTGRPGKSLREQFAGVVAWSCQNCNGALRAGVGVTTEKWRCVTNRCEGVFDMSCGLL